MAEDSFETKDVVVIDFELGGSIELNGLLSLDTLHLQALTKGVGNVDSLVEPPFNCKLTHDADVDGFYIGSAVRSVVQEILELIRYTWVSVQVKRY